MKRKEKFLKGEIYHVFNKSIANYEIFGSIEKSQQFINRLFYYNTSLAKDSFSKYIRKNKNYKCENLLLPQDFSYVKILAYCLMPDHYHLLVKILKDDVFSKLISDVENSFSRYLNTKQKRKGPLWQSNFKAVRIKNNEQLLHVSRYIHLNPTTANLVADPKDWRFSSYRDYINNRKILKEILKEISISDRKKYKIFVENNKDYQKKLKIIKKLIFD